MPIHNADNNERNAQLVFAYFHPFTLRRNVACTANPLPSSCKADHASWYASLEAWLDGSVLTQESAKHIRNYLNVTQMRPQDAQEDEEQSHASFSDEELVRKDADLENMLHTTPGASKELSGDVFEETLAEVQAQTYFRRSEHVWPAPVDVSVQAHTAVPKLPKEVFKRIQRAQKASQSSGDTPAWQAAQRDGVVKMRSSLTADKIRSWLKDKCSEVDECDQPRMKKKQAEVLERVTQRVLTEHVEANLSDKSEPLRWCVHGGPGVGKSYVIQQIRQFFEDVCDWEQGLDFQILALQAVMADQLGGETVHHALGIDPFRLARSKHHRRPRRLQRSYRNGDG